MEIKDAMLKYETTYSKYATKDIDAIHLKEFKSDIRPSFFRDTDRIIYSLAYTRYLDKTQVFSNSINDHVSKRITHVTLVSKIARTIGRALGLNEDLIEAIALGHDLGHVPFGHVGESILNDLSLKYDNTYFNHNVQSVRLLMEVENNGLGSNLTLQTLDGILCHNGELCLEKYEPIKKDKDDFLNQYSKCYTDLSMIKKLIPMTLEGCVVRISDIIGYVGRDIEDAVRLGILKKKEIPESITSVLGNNNKDIINTIILDVVNNSLDKPYIKMSKPVFEAMKELKNFNYEHIYSKAYSDEERKQQKIMFETLFKIYLNHLENNIFSEDIYKIFLNKMTDSYLKNTSNERKVIDYIAGMTDNYFMRQYDKYK